MLSQLFLAQNMMESASTLMKTDFPFPFPTIPTVFEAATVLRAKQLMQVRNAATRIDNPGKGMNEALLLPRNIM